MGHPRVVRAAGGSSNRDPQSSSRLDEFVQIYLRGRPRANVKVALRAVRRPLFHASLMVKAGEAAAMVAGVSCPTARVPQIHGYSDRLVRGLIRNANLNLTGE